MIFRLFLAALLLLPVTACGVKGGLKTPEQIEHDAAKKAQKAEKAKKKEEKKEEKSEEENQE